jgi:hypothetical protein
MCQVPRQCECKECEEKGLFVRGECRAKVLCKNLDCKRCHDRSFESFRCNAAFLVWSVNNAVSSRFVPISADGEFLFTRHDGSEGLYSLKAVKRLTEIYESNTNPPVYVCKCDACETGRPQLCVVKNYSMSCGHWGPLQPLDGY